MKPRNEDYVFAMAFLGFLALTLLGHGLAKMLGWL